MNIMTNSNSNNNPVNQAYVAYNNAQSEPGTMRKIYNFLRKARYFLPILSTIGWILGFCLPASAIVDVIGFGLIVIGHVSALLTCPIKMLKFVITVSGVIGGLAFKLTAFLLIGAIFTGLIGLIFGFWIGLMVVIFAPAAFTIYKYFTDSEYYGVR